MISQIRHTNKICFTTGRKPQECWPKIQVSVPSQGAVLRTVPTRSSYALHNKTIATVNRLYCNVKVMPDSAAHLQHLIKQLQQRGPAFPVSSKDISFLEGPTQFYEELKVKKKSLYSSNLIRVQHYVQKIE
jgi:hypothetical protein